MKNKTVKWIVINNLNFDINQSRSSLFCVSNDLVLQESKSGALTELARRTLFPNKIAHSPRPRSATRVQNPFVHWPKLLIAILPFCIKSNALSLERKRTDLIKQPFPFSSPDYLIELSGVEKLAFAQPENLLEKTNDEIVDEAKELSWIITNQ